MHIILFLVNLILLLFIIYSKKKTKIKSTSEKNFLYGFAIFCTVGSIIAIDIKEASSGYSVLAIILYVIYILKSGILKQYLFKSFQNQESNIIKYSQGLNLNNIKDINKVKERISRTSIMSDYDFTEEEIKEASKQLTSPYTERDRIWYILNKRQMIFFAQKEWDEFCDTQEDMASFLEEEGNYLQALNHYLNSFIIYFSGFFYNNEVWNIFHSVYSRIPPLLPSNIRYIMKVGNLTNSDLKLAINNNAYYKVLPFNYYSTENLYNILLDLFENNVDKIKKYPYNTPDKNSTLYTYVD